MSKNKDKRKKIKLSDYFQENLKLENKKLYFGSNVRFFELANLLKIDTKKISLFLNIENIDQLLSDEQIMEVAQKYKFDFEKVDDVSEQNILEKINNIILDTVDDVSKVERAPIVTIMGHVDHGKTTLLDTIRKTNVAAKEAGGITQKIGAYQIEWKNKKITFIDTPGHEAFSAMRSQGSQITDIAIIVVSADDSVMPQTKEAIEHAKLANVQIIIAINKIDKPGIDREKIKSQLSDLGVMPEEWGGNTPFIEISALKNIGIDKLLETILLISEIKELKAHEDVFATGVVLESNIDKQKGNLATLLVQNGTLHIGDNIIIDDTLIKVKSIFNDLNKRIDFALPSQPIEVFGIGFSPIVGSKFVVVNEDKNAQKIADSIKEGKKLKNNNKKIHANIEDLFSKSAGTNKKEFNVFLKADGNGVLEAISNKIKHFESDNIKVNLVRKDIGEITTADISLAQASNSTIYTFNLKVNDQINKLAESKKVKILSFDIIYKLFEDIEEKILGEKVKKFEEKKIGEIEVRALFNSSKFGIIAGCQVKSGKVTHKSIIEVTRKDKSIFKSDILSLKHMKDEVKERKEGQECGITLKGFSSFEAGDILISYELTEV